jgi:hypothetical protein
MKQPKHAIEGRAVYSTDSKGEITWSLILFKSFKKPRGFRGVQLSFAVVNGHRAYASVKEASKNLKDVAATMNIKIIRRT